MNTLGSYMVTKLSIESKAELKRRQAALHNDRYESKQAKTAAELAERETLRTAMKAEVTDAFHEVEK